MGSRPRTPPRARKHTRVTAERKKPVPAEEKKALAKLGHKPPIKDGAPFKAERPGVEDLPPRQGTLPEHPAYVAMGGTVGVKTEFARESLDAFCSVTLPCGISPEEREDAAEEAREQALSEARRMLDRAWEEFFPDLIPPEEDEDGPNDSRMEEDQE